MCLSLMNVFIFEAEWFIFEAECVYPECVRLNVFIFEAECVYL